MLESRAKRLAELGFFDWEKESQESKESRFGSFNRDYLNSLWEENFLKLKTFKEINGHCRVNVAKKSLNNWVRRQRSIFHKGKMSQDRIQKLDALGFEWKGQLFWRSKEEEIVISSDENTQPDDEIEGNDNEFLPSTKKRKRTEKCPSEVPKFIQEKRIPIPSNEEISMIDEFMIIQSKEL